jgi:hypothetical protein
MKTYLLTAAALALLTTAAHADTMTQAEWVSTLFVYQAGCQSLGISQSEFVEIMSPIPNADYKIASTKVTAAFFNDRARWCEDTQTLIAANRKWRFQN